MGYKKYKCNFVEPPILEKHTSSGMVKFVVFFCLKGLGGLSGIHPSESIVEGTLWNLDENGFSKSTEKKSIPLLEMCIWKNDAYHLVICYIAMVFRWPIEIDGLHGLPIIFMVIFHGYVK
jgi:hypothetical protein